MEACAVDLPREGESLPDRLPWHHLRVGSAGLSGLEGGEGGGRGGREREGSQIV